MSSIPTRTIARRAGLIAALLGTLGAGGCVSVHGPAYAAEIVRDLSGVAGCRFMATVQAPQIRPSLQFATYNDYLTEMRRRTVAAGGTHLYLMTDAASWGGAQAAGAVYRCT